MISLEERARVHHFIIVGFAIRAVQHDCSKLSTMKMGMIYEWLFAQILRKLYAEFHYLQQELSKRQIKLVSYRKLDTYFCLIVLTTPGEDLQLQYANQAIKKEVEQLLWALLRQFIFQRNQ